MNQTQTNYLTAKAAYETLIAEVNKRTQPHMYLLDEGKIDEFVDLEMQAGSELHVTEIWNLMIDAKNALMAWGYEAVKTRPEYKSNAADLDKVFQTAMSRRLPHITEKVVDLVLRLDESTL